MALFKRQFAEMSLYSPPLEGRTQGGRLLLDFNERTIPVSQVIEDALVDYVRSGALHRYPSYGDVVENIAGYANVPATRLMITNGSDQGIDLVFRAACSVGDEVIIPGPSFPMYIQAAQVEGANIIEPQYSRQEGYPLQAVLAAISERTRVIVVSNPNNPSGTLLSPQGVEVIARAAPNAVILVDECYFEYCKVSVVDLMDRCPNIIVVRTFSKTWGLPSLRIGYLIAQEHLLQDLLKIRGPYDINQMAVVAVQTAMANQHLVNAYLDEVMQVSKPKLEAWLDARDIPYWPSAANFLWVFFDNARALEQILRDNNILVRPKVDAGGVMGLRITIGTQSQVDQLINVLESACSG